MADSRRPPLTMLLTLVRRIWLRSSRPNANQAVGLFLATNLLCSFVGEVGLEPTNLSVQGPKPCASANFATRPYSSSTAKVFFFAFSNLGKITVKRPFFKEAFALSAFTS